MLLTSKQNAAVRRFDDLVEKLPLGHLAIVVFGIAADVFDDDGNLKKILHLANALRRHFRCLQGVRASAADRACSVPSTLPQQRWSESHGVLVRRTSVFSRFRCSRLSGSAEPKYIETPCCTTRY